MTHLPACPKYPVAKLIDRLPARYLAALEQNQKIASCCRHPENHQIEAWYSCEAEAEKGVPDIYKFHCPCGKVHTRFCVGGNHPDAKSHLPTARPDLYDIRPKWEIR